MNAELACVNSIRPTDFENSIFFFHSLSSSSPSREGIKRNNNKQKSN